MAKKNKKVVSKLRKASPVKSEATQSAAGAGRAEIPAYSSFADALERSGLGPLEVLAKFKAGKIRVEPFSRYPMGLLGSLKIGRVVEGRIYGGAKSVTLTAEDVRRIYATGVEDLH